MLKIIGKKVYLTAEIGYDARSPLSALIVGRPVKSCTRMCLKMVIMVDVYVYYTIRTKK